MEGSEGRVAARCRRPFCCASVLCPCAGSYVSPITAPIDEVVATVEAALASARGGAAADLGE